jgi:hypothetical protein
MKLDSENDRKILMELISRSQIAGGAAPVIADLMQRISMAEIEKAEAGTDKVKKAA